MRRLLLLSTLLATPLAAQQAMDHSAMMGSTMTPPAGVVAGMETGEMPANMASMPQGVGGSPLNEPGQSAFAAIAEVVRVLEADPNTNWSNVNIDALREHLRDMDVVTLSSSTQTDEIDGGLRFTVTGDRSVAPSITRMVLGHASFMDGKNGWNYSADAINGGAIMTVTVPESDLAKLTGLGFYGMLAVGMHHQPHHWMMANGGGMGG